MAEHVSAPDLLSLVLALRPTARSDRPAAAWWGRASHALLLDTVELTDAALARALHEGSGPRPFTASSLLGHLPGGRLDPAEIYTLRFTALRGDVARCLLAASQPGGPWAPGAVLTLDGLALSVVGALTAAAEHPWAGSESYAGLAAARLVGGDPAARQVSLLFTSPTSFRSQERHVPLPLPELVFGSLLERWNAFAPLALPAEVKRYAAECLAISRYDLATRPVPGKEGGLRVGAVGQITYATLNYDRYWMSILHALAAFALYAGVGVGTTSGLGQCRPADRNEARPEE